MRMRASGIIVRFIPLLDVAFILLGMVIILVAQAQIRSVKTSPKPAPAKSLAEQAALDALKPGEDLVALQHAFDAADEAKQEDVK